MTHGRILCGTATTPDLDAAIGDYAGTLGLRMVERGDVDDALATSWGAPASAGAATALLQPTSGEASFLRLVEQPVPADFKPTRTFGWAAFEFTVQGVHDWAERMGDTGFNIIGPPREIPGLPYFVAMQMLGRGREMVYLNEVRSDTPTSDLPRAICPVGPIFIVILACADRPAVLAAARELVAGGVETVVVSLGAEGAVFVSGENAVFTEPMPVKVASTVGAGDAMMAGTVAGLLRGAALQDVAALATAFSAVTVVRVGPHLDPAAVRRTVASVVVERLPALVGRP